MLLRSLLYSSENETKNNLKKTKCILGQEFHDEKISIRIRCMWDSAISHHDIAEPMYKTWEHDGYGKTEQMKFIYDFLCYRWSSYNSCERVNHR